MIDLSQVSRRDLLKALGAFGAAGLTIGLGGCESCVQQINNRPTRRNISNLAANDPIINAYKAAVAAMKALPSTDPRNWTQQANVHYNHCPHGNWWFLPWHRAYLLYFERICRKMSGNNDFALPYWNWTTNPSIPAPFWDTGLNDGTRVANASDQVDPSFVGAPAIENILSQTNFFLFASGQATNQRDFSAYGMLEGTPHNNVHNFVGGDMGAFHSPLDPVFWSHHNMLDCLWVDWNINRNNPNSNDTNWTNFQFTDFVDENGAAVTVNVLTTILFPIFSYQFEPCAPNEKQSTLSRNALEQFLRQGAPAKLEFSQRFQLQQTIAGEVGKPVTGAIKVDPAAFRSVLEAGAKNAVVLTIGGVEIPDKADYFVRVFLNKTDVSADTPISDPHYAGSFALFFDPAAMKDMASHTKPGYLVDVTPTIRRLNQSGGLGGQVSVSLVPVPYPGRKAAGQRLSLD